jgi:hypothetical protein
VRTLSDSPPGIPLDAADPQFFAIRTFEPRGATLPAEKALRAPARSRRAEAWTVTPKSKMVLAGEIAVCGGRAGLKSRGKDPRDPGGRCGAAIPTIGADRGAGSDNGSHRSGGTALCAMLCMTLDF